MFLREANPEDFPDLFQIIFLAEEMLKERALLGLGSSWLGCEQWRSSRCRDVL